MKATYGITNVDSVETTLRITMKISEWRSLAAMMQGQPFPAWPLANEIGEMIVRAHKQYSTMDVKGEE